MDLQGQPCIKISSHSADRQRDATAVPENDGEEQSEPPRSFNCSPHLGHRRQASKGLGIITSLDQDARPISDPTGSHTPKLNTSGQASAAQRTTGCNVDGEHLSSHANSARLHTHGGLDHTTSSPIPSHFPHPRTDSAISVPSAHSEHWHHTRDPLARVRSYHSPGPISDDDEIVPLPSPFPRSGDTASPRHHQFVFTEDRAPSPSTPVTPDENESPLPTTTVPVITTSTPFTTKLNQIPKLADHPMLGDVDELEGEKPKVSESLMTREQNKLANALDNDLTGKYIGQFRVEKLLGVGAFSKVYLAEHRTLHTKYAIKAIQKSSMVGDGRIRASIEREVGVLKFIDHPNIVRLDSTMETEHFLCIVLEYAAGGELFEFVQKMHRSGTMDESMVKKIFLQLVHVVQWMHEHNIVHRDLKLENILIRTDDDQQIELKVTDFGLARVIDPQSPTLKTRCGSEEYAAPEIVQTKGYDGRMTDTWSLGIILYALLVGYLPFRYNPARGERTSLMFYRIVKAEVKWPDRPISDEAKEVVERILVRNPEKRIKLGEIEQCSWFQS